MPKKMSESADEKGKQIKRALFKYSRKCKKKIENAYGPFDAILRSN